MSKRLSMPPEYENMGEIKDIVEIQGGWESPIFSFALVSQDADEVKKTYFVLRYYEGSEAQKKAEKDFHVMERVSQLGIHVPMPMFTFQSDASEESYLVMEKIEGRLAADFESDSKSGQRVLEELATIQAYLHNLPIEDFQIPLINNDSKETKKNFFLTYKEDLELSILEHKLEDFTPIIDWLEENIPVDLEAEIAFLHNDFHPENVIVSKEDGALFVLDWGFAGFGDRRMDLAWSVLQIENMLGAEARKDYLSYYEDAIGRKTNALTSIEALKLTERLITIASWLVPGFETPIKKIDAEAIRGTYRVHVLNVYERLREITGIKIRTFEDL